MLLNLSEQQSEFLEELLFIKYKELEVELINRKYELNYVAKDYIKPNLKQQIQEIKKYLDNMKELLDVIENSKI